MSKYERECEQLGCRVAMQRLPFRADTELFNERLMLYVDNWHERDCCRIDDANRRYYGREGFQATAWDEYLHEAFNK